MLLQDSSCVVGYVTLCITELNDFAQIGVHWHNMLTYRTTLRHFVMPLLVSLRNGVWEMSAEIPYQWCVTTGTQVWVASAYDSLKQVPLQNYLSEALPRSG